MVIDGLPDEVDAEPPMRAQTAEPEGATCALATSPALRRPVGTARPDLPDLRPHRRHPTGGLGVTARGLEARPPPDAPDRRAARRRSGAPDRAAGDEGGADRPGPPQRGHLLPRPRPGDDRRVEAGPARAPRLVPQRPGQPGDHLRRATVPGR